MGASLVHRTAYVGKDAARAQQLMACLTSQNRPDSIVGVPYARSGLAFFGNARVPQDVRTALHTTAVAIVRGTASPSFVSTDECSRVTRITCTATDLIVAHVATCPGMIRRVVDVDQSAVRGPHRVGLFRARIAGRGQRNIRHCLAAGGGQEEIKVIDFRSLCEGDECKVVVYCSRVVSLLQQVRYV